MLSNCMLMVPVSQVHLGAWSSSDANGFHRCLSLSLLFLTAFLAFLICHAWLPSLVSSQTTSMATSPNQSSTASVSMTTNSSSTSAMASSSASAPVPASTTSASSSMVPTTVASTSVTDSTTKSSASVSLSSNASSSSSSSPATYNSTISCRSFYCDGTNCYSMFMNTTPTACPYGCDYCEFRQYNESMYSVGCADSCNASRCVNDTQVDCVKNCCNTTDCLNATLQAMESSPTPTVPTTTKQTTTTTTTTPAPTTRPSNGRKCKSLTCTGADCYTTTQSVMTWCYNTQTYCQLKKTTVGSTANWMASCSTDCSSQTACTASTPTCHQECCEASAAGDCLKLNGKVNMPNSGGSRAIYSPLVLLAPSLVAWLLLLGELL
ncbi:hypothetical protein ACEWY4_020458 [Coilia grayii]|uniref:Uncharacterized protein n=1 Tax=Coilia grayii TaxID=363190 RepID=A0ABD1JEC6_9TELE